MDKVGRIISSLYGTVLNSFLNLISHKLQLTLIISKVQVQGNQLLLLLMIMQQTFKDGTHDLITLKAYTN